MQSYLPFRHKVNVEKTTSKIHKQSSQICEISPFLVKTRRISQLNRTIY